MKHAPPAGQQLSFHAELENWAEGMDYCAVPVPAEITKALGTRGPVLVMARINDSAAFQVSLFPVGGGQHYIRVKARVRKETNTKVGDRIEVRFTVLDRAQTDIPEDLMNALRAQEAEADFKSLSPASRVSSSGASTRPPNRKPAPSEFRRLLQLRRVRPKPSTKTSPRVKRAGCFLAVFASKAGCSAVGYWWMPGISDSADGGAG